jgi:ribosomal protein S18 acetylase RimI-like enzyme
MEFITTTKKEIDENIDLLLNETQSFKFETWNKDNFLMDLPRKWELSIVAKSGNEIVGFSFNSQKEGAMHIHYFYVFQTYRNNKLGVLMLKKCIDLVRQYKLQMITLRCNVSNYRALEFYLKNDFAIASLEGEFYGLYKNIDIE